MFVFVVWICALKVSTIVSKLFSLALQILCLYVKHCQTQSVTDWELACLVHSWARKETKRKKQSAIEKRACLVIVYHMYIIRCETCLDIFICITSISNVKAIPEIILPITSSHGIIVDGTIWSTANNIIECRAFESFTMTELNDRFARVGKVDVMEIGSDYELDLFLLIFWRRIICLVYTNTNKIQNCNVEFACKIRQFYRMLI